MATYYVKTAADGGSNTANGLSASTAWATVAYALTSASGFASGDTLYVAPGIYTNAITVTIANPTVETNIIGDVTAAQFTGINPGVVVLTNFNSTLTASGVTANVISATTKDYLHFQNIQFKLHDYSVVFTTCSNLKFTKCTLFQQRYYVNSFSITSAVGQAVNATFTKCVFIGGNNIVTITGRNVADTTSFTDCIFMGAYALGLSLVSVQATIYNCTFFSNASAGIRMDSGSLTYLTTVRNSLFWGHVQDLWSSSPSFTIIENYNRLLSFTPRTNVANNLTSSNAGDLGVDTFESILYGLPNVQPFSSYLNSPNASFGNATGAPSVDIYGNTWSGSSPDTGAATYKVLTGAYEPTERNAGVITIAPGSTSQSIELYLGVTGLTSSSSGLSTRYNRTRTASVSIPLVARTIAQAWTAGGFAEVDATNMPGVYRIDIPDAALAAGADDVTIVVRGASGTNGAVMTVKLSSGGLTEAQTAGAVWNGVRASYTTPGTFGEYVNAELVTPVTSAALVRMGPYEVKADGLGASDPLDIQKGAQHGVDIQCVDGNGNGIDITSATVTAKVYNSGATLVDTYACTATYAADGRATFTIDTTVTNTPGTYTATITRTTGASDTQVFGPLRIYVRDI